MFDFADFTINIPTSPVHIAGYVFSLGMAFFLFRYLVYICKAVWFMTKLCWWAKWKVIQVFMASFTVAAGFYLINYALSGKITPQGDDWIPIAVIPTLILLVGCGIVAAIENDNHREYPERR